MTNSHLTEGRRALLFRKAQAKRVLPGYTDKIGTLLSVANSADFLSLETTDAVLETFKKRTSSLRQRRRRISPAGVRLSLSRISKICGEGVYAFIDDDWKYCGAIFIRDHRSISLNCRFGDAILNDLLFIDASMNWAVSLDFFEVNQRQLVDVIEWGHSSPSTTACRSAT